MISILIGNEQAPQPQCYIILNVQEALSVRFVVVVYHVIIVAMDCQGNFGQWFLYLNIGQYLFEIQ